MIVARSWHGVSPFFTDGLSQLRKSLYERGNNTMPGIIARAFTSGYKV